MEMFPRFDHAGEEHGFPLEDRVMDPQPHAVDLHAGGTYTYSQPPANQGLICRAGGYGEAGFTSTRLLDQQYTSHHSNLTTGDLATSDYDDFSKPISYNGFNCQYPGCYAFFPSQGMLDEHSKVHGNYMQSTAGPTLTGSPHNHYFDFGNPANNFIGPWIPAFTPASIPVDGQNSYTVVGADAAEPSLPASPQGTTPSTASSPTGRLLCSYPGCHTKCARAGDLRRHALKHQTGPKAFECPNPGCPRKGLHAFARKDKMLSHAKVCRGGARGERSRA